MNWDVWFCEIMANCRVQYERLARLAKDNDDLGKATYYTQLAALSSGCRTKGLRLIAKSINDKT